MKSRIALLLCVASVLSLLPGCSNLPKLQVIVLGSADSGTTISANTADRLVIVLPANGSTGFSWQVTAGDTSVVSLDQTKDIVESTGGVVGQGGVEVLVFNVDLAGSTTLTLGYVQAGAPSGTAPAETWSITVNVQS